MKKNEMTLSNFHTNECNCYLTTMLCHSLKLSHDNIYLNAFKDFRKNVLQQNEKYRDLLAEFDIISPMISECLANDPLGRKIADYYFNKYIVDMFYYILNNETEIAVKEYIEMTRALKQYYNLNNHNISNDSISNTNLENNRYRTYGQKKITL